MKKFIEKQYEKLDPNVRRLIAYMPQHRWVLSGAVLFMVVAATTSSLIAMLFGRLTDLGFYDQQPWIVLAAPLALILVAFVHGGSMFMSNYLLARVSQSILFELREELFNKVLHWSEDVYQRNITGIIASKFVNEANHALSGATKSAIILVRDSLRIVGLIAVLIWNDVTLTLVAILVVPAIVWLLRFISKKIRSIMASAQQSIASLLVRVKEAYDTRTIIKISNAYEVEERKFDEISQYVKRLNLQITKVKSAATPATQLIGVCGVAVVLTVAMIETQRGLLSLGEFITFLTAMMLILPPLKRITALNSTFIGMSVAAGSIFSTLDEPEERDQGTQELEKGPSTIHFDHVSLRYPGANRDAVRGFSLQVQSGETVALVGASGSGKSSLISLLPRFWNPTSGKILFDDIDIQTVTLASLRRQIAIVSQDVIIFDGTIRDNITYGSPQATNEEIALAIESAALVEFIESLPQGLDTPVGENGGRLSGGQRQRISIARALLKNAPILILDEATSALDAENEHKIKEALMKLMQGRTTFIVAHRLSTIEHADVIIAMQEGEIKEMGTHEELLQRKGVYAHLCQLQGINLTGNAAEELKR